MAQIIWYLKIQDNLVKYKDKFFRPADYLDLQAYIQETIDANPAGSGVSAISDITGLQTALDAKQNDLILTTNGTSGAATIIGDTLNIPTYTGGITQAQALAINSLGVLI